MAKPAPTAIDHITVVLSPALIMGLVGSLVFFLLEVLYKADGPFKGRLQWILASYVFGIVLNARVSMQGDGADRSTLYGLVLSVLTYIGMQSLVEYPEEVRPLSFIVNLALVTVVWWSSHRLVWDCTHVDDDANAPAEGLLQAAGIDAIPKHDAPPEMDEKGRPLGWIERYRRWRDKQSRTHVLGVWVVYFSLAALPIFGMGQTLVPLDDTTRRRFTFWLMTAYVGSGLGLLLTTCFLGLRRHLRQRGVTMPPSLTAAWVTTGGGLLLALLLAGALLPRPYSEYPWFNKAGSPDREANRLGGQGKGARGKGDPGDARKDGQETGDRAGKDGESPGKDSGQKDRDGKDGGGRKDSDGKGSQKGDGKGDVAKGLKSLHPPPLPWLNDMAGWLKWIIFVVLGVIVAIVVIRQLIAFLANFTDWARRWLDWWNSLFGGPKASRENVDEQASPPEPDVPFAAFANPFTTGRAERMPPRELVRHALAAFEAWARERGMPRRDDETAIEFLDRVADALPAVEAEGRRLVLLHATAEYGGGQLPDSTPDTVRAFWRQLEKMVVAPMSA